MADWMKAAETAGDRGDNQEFASALFIGSVLHTRLKPVVHTFRYRASMLYLDLDELPRVFKGTRLWSLDRPNLASFRRQDYLGPQDRPLKEAVLDLVEARCGKRPRGPIRLLTKARNFGFVFNPVSFYFCYDGGTQPAFIVSEIENTPWGERHAYVLPANAGNESGQTLSFRFGKEFHVSPFMPMDCDYEWRFTLEADSIQISMRNSRRGGVEFFARLALRRQAWDCRTLDRLVLTQPFSALKVITAIYWQAFRLWTKRVPFHPHPGKREGFAGNQKAEQHQHD